MISVEYVDHMGNDLRVANAARKSFGADYQEWSETPRTPRGRSDRELVEDLADDGHILPFRHPHLTLEGVAPLPVARQLEKHQVGFTWSEISRRYQTKGLTFHKIDVWRRAAEEKRQGSGPPVDSNVQALLESIQQVSERDAVNAYKQALRLGAAPEQARFLLPQSMDVYWTWTGSLLGFANLYIGRTHPDVQAETRQFAEGVAAICAPLFPVAWKALIER